MHRKLAELYCLKDTPFANALFVTSFQKAAHPAQANLLALTFLLLNDGLTYELSRGWLTPKLSGPMFEAETTDIERELEFIEEAHPVIKIWNPITRKRIARHYLSLVRACGYASGSAEKEIRRPNISSQVILFAIQFNWEW